MELSKAIAYHPSVVPELEERTKSKAKFPLWQTVARLSRVNGESDVIHQTGSQKKPRISAQIEAIEPVC